MRTLIVKYSSFGDVIHAIPLAEAICRKNPVEEITWLVEEKYQELLRGNPFIREVIPFRKPSRKEGMKGLKNLFALLAGLRERRFDRVIDPQGLFLSGLIVLATGAKERIGFANAREMASWTYTRKVLPPKPSMHAVDRYFCLIDGNAEDPVNFYIPRVAASWDKVKTILEKNGCQTGKPIILLCPTSRWATKNWPLDRFMDVARKFYESTGSKAVFIGSPDERDIGLALDKHLEGKSVNFLGPDALGIPELVALMERARLLVTNDSGPMHLAAAVGLPIVAIFGPTSEYLTGPKSAKAQVMSASVSCRPCFKKICPIRTHVCMKNIGADDVWKICEKYF